MIQYIARCKDCEWNALGSTAWGMMRAAHQHHSNHTITIVKSHPR